MSFWRETFKTQEISYLLDKIRPLRTISEKGDISITGGGSVDIYAAILMSAIDFGIKSDRIKSRIVRKTLFSADLKLDFTEKDFRDVANRLSHTLQYKDVKEYKVVFPLWNLPPFLTGIRKIGCVTINFSPSKQTKLFKKIIRARNEQRKMEIFQTHFSDRIISDLNECSHCIAHVSAHDQAHAYEQACDAIYEVIGLVNIANDIGKYWRLSSPRDGRKIPVSDVLIGPHVTTHVVNGSLANGVFWYEDWAGGPRKKQISSEVIKHWEEKFLQLTRSISKSLWAEKCKSAAIRYYKAFSKPNLEESFLEGWRLFEYISGSRYESTEKKITRASHAFAENTEYRITGKHLSIRRNLITHGHPILADDEETLAFQLRHFLSPFLVQFITNGFRFTKPEEFWEFLDLPASHSKRTAEAAELRRRLTLFDKAAQFRDESSDL